MLPIKKKIAILGGKLLQTFTTRSTGKELLSKKTKTIFSRVHAAVLDTVRLLKFLW